MKALRAVLLLLLLCGSALAVEPTLTLPPSVTGEPGDFIKITATTNGKEVRWVTLTPGLNVFPAEMLRDSRTTVCVATKAGAYRVLAYTALDDLPSDPAITVVTVGTVPVVVIPPVVPPVVPPIVPPVVPPPTPNQKVSQVTYVFEKDFNNPPRAVSLALQKLNVDSGYAIAASEFEEDSVAGNGQTPTQYKTALTAAREAGLPALVVQSNGTVIRVVKNPTTEAQVLEAAKP